MKVLSNKKYNEMIAKQNINEFYMRGFRANMKSLAYERAMVAIMKKCGLKEITLDDTYFFDNDIIEVEITPLNQTKIKIKSIDNN